MKTHYPEYTQLDLAAVQREVLAQWEAEETFAQSLAQRADAPNFVFYEGPPSANGLPGIHHVMARTLKDAFCRYKTQRGFRVGRRAGWDTHGLPVELGVEKELGISKEDIGKTITIEEYNAACRKAVMRYTGIWNDLTRQMGYWVDQENAYVTYKTPYIESVWWLLSQIYNKGLLYKGYTIQPYSPAAGTGLSSHELNQPGCYKDVTDTSVTAQFAVEPSDQSRALFGDSAVHLLAWTTTPWTLPSNTALTVGPDIEYTRIATENPYTHAAVEVVLATALVPNYFKAEEEGLVWTRRSTHLGSELVGLRYEQLLPGALPHENADQAFRVIPGDFVTTVDGTGMVHTAPTFGADDARVAAAAGVPPMLVLNEDGDPVPLVDLRGRFIPQAGGSWAGKFVKNAYYPEGEAPKLSVDEEIAIQLKTKNKAFKVQKYVHCYPHCWRTDKPVLYYPLDSWFIRATAVKERMQALNNTIQWKPASTGTGRFGNWLESLNDWNLSRSRYWGIPLPLWRTEDGKETVCVGSLEQLKEALEVSVAAGHMASNPLAHFTPGDFSAANYDAVDLHRPHVDEWVLTSPSGKPMRRETDLIDVWFDSGAMPFAQLHYPFENKEAVDGGSAFPADFIAEGVDQTRGWFYTLHAIAALVKDSVAYKNVISNGLVLDKNGQKMSKRLGNAVDPFAAMDTHGADAVRWYLLTNAQPWDNLKYDPDGVTEVQRKFFGTLYNTYGFFSLYANVDGFDPKTTPAVNPSDRPEIDRWILSRLQSLVAEVTEHMDQYEPTKAYRPVQEFVTDHLSNWYVRLCRRRFWKGEMGADKRAAYHTLHTCLDTVARLMAPLAPFYADRLYRDLNGGVSVHLSSFPEVDAAQLDAGLEARMDLAQGLTSLVLSVRKRTKMRVRQPLAKMLVPVLSEERRAELAAITPLVLAEVNIKELVPVTAESGVFTKKAKANFKALGPKAGASMKEVAAGIAALSPEALNALETSGSWTLQLPSGSFELTPEDVEITTEVQAGLEVASERGLTVAVDTALTPELEAEGWARETVNRIQNLRKDSGLEITDRISLWVQAPSPLREALMAHAEWVASEVLAVGLAWDLRGIPASAVPTDVEVEGLTCQVVLEKA
jgi:isoleucyl-tRNA synthetase